MKKATIADLADLVDILEGLTKKLDETSEPELIDLAARLKPAAKHCEAIDKYVKDNVKKKLKHRAGIRLGELFKAVLQIIPVTRLQQAELKDGEPAIYAAYSRSDADERVTFELR